MAIGDAKKRRIGRELVDWVMLGIQTGAIRSVAEYRALAVPDPVKAKAQLTRAVNMPRRARARIDNWIEDYDAANGAGAGQTFLVECLALAGSVTLGQLNSEVTRLETLAQTVIDNNNAGSLTLDQVATAIENNLQNEAQEWAFPLPAAYADLTLVG